MKQLAVGIFIPFRDRGTDLRRGANLDLVQAWWYSHGLPAHLVGDGLSGDAPFNRHRAYNNVLEAFPGIDCFIFTEADMLIHPQQIADGIDRALAEPGLVVPFTQYRYWSDETTAKHRDLYNEDLSTTAELWAQHPSSPSSIFQIEPESTMDNGKSIGAVNIVSRKTLEMTGGFTEATSGNWYDDNIIEEGFAYLTGNKTRYIEGPAVHLYHLPGWKGDHLSDEDKAATERNRSLLIRMRADIKMRDAKAVRALMAHRAP